MKFDYKKTPVTIIVIGICVGVYIITTALYGVTMNGYEGQMTGGFNPILVLERNQYYRLITANFIHFGLMHIFFNCYSLLNIGPVLELMLGMKRYIIVVVGSMFATTIFPCVLYLLFGTGANTIAGGISGVIFGLLGALWALAICFKQVYLEIFKQVLPSIVLMLGLSLLVPSISLIGHVSGMLGGFIITYVVIKKYPRRSWIRFKKVEPDNLVN